MHGAAGCNRINHLLDWSPAPKCSTLHRFTKRTDTKTDTSCSLFPITSPPSAALFKAYFLRCNEIHKSSSSCKLNGHQRPGLHRAARNCILLRHEVTSLVCDHMSARGYATGLRRSILAIRNGTSSLTAGQTVGATTHDHRYRDCKRQGI